ncbi:MAG: iron ABC transporter permease [Acidimicrobiia bacterium]|nr:iron ABC transporter permease [Acidimicrobiia bacterium]
MKRLALIGIPLAFLGYFFVYPIASILWLGISEDGGRGFREALGGSWDVAWFTLWQAVVSTVVTLVVAMPGAYVLGRFDFPGKSFVRAIVTVPFVLPTVVVGTAFLALIGPSGVLGVDLDGTIWAILLAHVFFNYAVIVRTVGGLWANLDPRLTEAARMLGASRWRAFTRVTLPLLRPAIAAASSIVFLFTFSSFGVVLILGGLRHRTLEVEIWRQTTAFLDLPVAAALAILQLVGVGAILFAYSRYQERRSVQMQLRARSETTIRPTTARQRLLVGANVAIMTVLLGGPMVVLAVRSLGDGPSFANYAALADAGRRSVSFVPPVEAVRNSVLIAFAATAIALIVGGLAAGVVAYRRGRVSQWFDALLMLPLGTSAVTIGLGFLIALDTPIDLRTSLALVPIAHALVAIPLVVRTTVPVMRSVRTTLREAAAVLGASPARAWRAVDLPLVSRALVVGAGFAFAISLGEFGATSFIARPDTPTMPVAIFRLLDQPGTASFGSAMAMSTILMVVTAAAIVAIERFRVADLGEF